MTYEFPDPEEMKIKYRRKCLVAIDKLLTFYRKYKKTEVPTSYSISNNEMCPLCLLYEDCMGCPWILFRKKSCKKNDYDKDTARKELTGWKNGRN